MLEYYPWEHTSVDLTLDTPVSPSFKNSKKCAGGISRCAIHSIFVSCRGWDKHDGPGAQVDNSITSHMLASFRVFRTTHGFLIKCLHYKNSGHSCALVLYTTFDFSPEKFVRLSEHVSQHVNLSKYQQRRTEEPEK